MRRSRTSGCVATPGCTPESSPHGGQARRAPPRDCSTLRGPRNRTPPRGRRKRGRPRTRGRRSGHSRGGTPPPRDPGPPWRARPRSRRRGGGPSGAHQSRRRFNGSAVSFGGVSLRTFADPHRTVNDGATIRTSRHWVEDLRAQRRMQPVGLEAFEARAKGRSGIYSYEQRKTAELDVAQLRKFRANRNAWEFFLAQPPSYQKAAVWWVITAKTETTKLKRLGQLIDDSAHGRTVPPLTRRNLKRG